jgi:hypothetical protein
LCLYWRINSKKNKKLKDVVDLAWWHDKSDAMLSSLTVVLNNQQLKIQMHSLYRAAFPLDCQWTKTTMFTTQTRVSEVPSYSI